MVGSHPRGGLPTVSLSKLAVSANSADAMAVPMQATIAIIRTKAIVIIMI
jgi:hypothetical protein